METCCMCEGTGIVEVAAKGEKWRQAPCPYKGTKAAQWEGIEWLVRQFVRRGNEFDPDNPTVSKCEGCTFERQELLSAIWHYGHDRDG